MKVTMAQLNFTVGDISGNFEKIKRVIKAHQADSELIVFSELAITGYYPRDLLLNESLIESQNQVLDQICQLTEQGNAGVVIGAVENNPNSGKPFYNTLFLISDGNIQYRYRKQLLPTYGVFSEARHFQAGNQPGLYRWRNQRLGFLICEDAWIDEEKPLYQFDPIDALVGENLDLVVSVNASPSHIGKLDDRQKIVRRVAQQCNAPFIYVNQVGGIDDVIFDGGSMVADEKGQTLAMAPCFIEDCLTVNTQSKTPVKLISYSRLGYMAEQLKLGIKDYLNKTGFSQVVIGSSGGIDSALTIALASWALGPENVIAVTMPSQYSSSGSIDDSQALCDNLGIVLHSIPIKMTFEQFVADYKNAFGNNPSPLAQENLQARIRGTLLMTYSNTTNALVLSTGNKSELAVGYCTLYGDMNGGLAVLGDVYKTDVFALSRYINEEVFQREMIPEAIITKPPSAELAPDQLDSDALPDYESLDALLRLYLESDLLSEAQKKIDLMVASKVNKGEQKRIRMLVDRNEYKRNQGAPVIRVNPRAFGSDRQVPITARLLQ